MKKYKKHQDSTLSLILKRIEEVKVIVEEIKHVSQLLATSENCKHWAYDQLLKANQEIIKIERERRESGSIYTVSKREKELEKQLESERMRADGLAEMLEKSEKENERLKQQHREMARVPMSREKAAEIFFEGEEQKGGESDA